MNNMCSTNYGRNISTRVIAWLECAFTEFCFMVLQFTLMDAIHVKTTRMPLSKLRTPKWTRVYTDLSAN